MKKLTQIGLLLALILGFTAESNAALLLEPVVGYSVGKAVTQFTDDDEEKDGIRGVSYGGRLGFQKLGFQIGVDYLGSTMDYDGEDLKTTEWGGFVGFEFPVLLRVYGGYIFSGSGTMKKDQTNVDDEINLNGGVGPKLGIGFTLLPFLDLNIEYRSVKYATEKDVKLTDDMDAKYETIMFGVSLPFTL